MPRYVLDPDRLTKDQQRRVGSVLEKAGTPYARLVPITVTINSDWWASVEYGAAIVLSPDAVREISDIIYLYGE